MARRQPSVGALDAATTQALLARYLSVGMALGRRHGRLDEATIRATAEDAILEAHLTWDPEKAQEPTWVRQVLRWRLAAAAASERAWSGLERFPSPDPQVLNGVDPEEAFWRASCVSAIGRLSPRQQNIVAGRMEGLTYAELGEQLGVSYTITHREGQRAYALLRKILHIRLPGDDADSVD